ILNGDATDEDIREYNRWCHSFQEKESLVPDFSEVKTETIAEIEKRIHRNNKSKQFGLWVKIAAAASVIFALYFGSHYLLNRHSPERIAGIQSGVMQPGTNKAVLT